jgi:hypothetical protein
MASAEEVFAKLLMSFIPSSSGTESRQKQKGSDRDADRRSPAKWDLLQRIEDLEEEMEFLRSAVECLKGERRQRRETGSGDVLRVYDIIEDVTRVCCTAIRGDKDSKEKGDKKGKTDDLPDDSCFLSQTENQENSIPSTTKGESDSKKVSTSQELYGTFGSFNTILMEISKALKVNEEVSQLPFVKGLKVLMNDVLMNDRAEAKKEKQEPKDDGDATK